MYPAERNYAIDAVENNILLILEAYHQHRTGHKRKEKTPLVVMTQQHD